MAKLEQAIQGAAFAAGFDLCGFATAGPPPHGDYFKAWLARGNAAEMDYLGAGLAKRLDLEQILPGVRSVISLGIRYDPPPLPPVRWREELRGRIAAYALGRDYHDVLRKRLKRLAGALRELVPGIEHRIYVDAGPVLERDWAQRSGVGWFGKNTNILNKAHGSWFFLAEVLTTLELEPTDAVSDHCGTCVTCLDRCPTAALRPGYELDARLCISYWTIEHRGPIPYELRPQLGNWIFGCDICQEVCPWNEKMRPGATTVGALLPYLPDLLRLDEVGFRERFRGSAVRRTKREGLARNVAVVLGNSGNPAAVPALAQCLSDEPSPLVRAHAAWALGCIDDRSARAALAAARRHASGEVCAEIEAALGGCHVTRDVVS